MPLKLNRYEVAVARDGLDLDKALEAGEGDGYDVHRVVVMHADQLAAEKTARKFGMPPLDAENSEKLGWATLWCWCALRRMGVNVPEFPLFKGRVIDVELIQPEGAEPDPTPPTDPAPDIGSP